tara:strand:- start:73 stop:360 length:288 start_codon:yes stop_codon:yes gene_type:complete
MNKILTKIIKTKNDKGIFRIWITISMLWISFMFIYLVKHKLFTFYAAGEEVNGFTPLLAHTPLDALINVITNCLLPPLVLLGVWMLIKWIIKGFK